MTADRCKTDDIEAAARFLGRSTRPRDGCEASRQPPQLAHAGPTPQSGRGVTIAVVASRERKRRDPRLTSISSALRPKTDEPQRESRQQLSRSPAAASRVYRHVHHRKRENLFGVRQIEIFARAARTSAETAVECAGHETDDSLLRRPIRRSRAACAGPGARTVPSWPGFLPAPHGRRRDRVPGGAGHDGRAEEGGTPLPLFCRTNRTIPLGGKIGGTPHSISGGSNGNFRLRGPHLAPRGHFG
jgi:hypothetical protein